MSILNYTISSFFFFFLLENSRNDDDKKTAKFLLVCNNFINNLFLIDGERWSWAIAQRTEFYIMLLLKNESINM